MGLVGTYMIGGSPTIHSIGQKQKGPTIRPDVYITPVAWRIVHPLERGPNHKWPPIGPGGYVTPVIGGGDPPCFTTGKKISNGTQMGPGVT